MLAFATLALAAPAAWSQSRSYPPSLLRRVPAGDSSATSRGTVAPSIDDVPIAGTPLNLRAIVNAIDGLGRAIDEPGFYEIAIRTVERLAGERHPLSGYLHVRLARLAWERRDRDTALEHALAGEDILREQLHLKLEELSEADSRRLARLRETALDLLLTIAADDTRPEVRRRCWDAFVRSRALVLDEMASRQRAAVFGRDTTLARVADALADARRQLARESFRTPDDDGGSRARLDRLRVRRDSLERELARRSRPFRDDLARSRAGLADVERALPPGDAVIAFACYVEPARPAPASASRSYHGIATPPAAVARVMAFVLRPGTRIVETRALARAGQLDSTVARWRALVTAPAEGEAPALAAAGAELRRLAWDPLAPLVAGAAHVWIVLDGSLQLVSFDALPADTRGRYLAEVAPPLGYLSAERDLVPSQAQERCGLVALGGIAYGGGAGDGTRGVPACGGVQPMRLADLPASATEVADVASLWRRSVAHDGGCPPVVLTGERATSAELAREAGHASVVHISAHGFFLACGLDEDSVAARRPSRAWDLAPPAAGTTSPMLLSGLVLARDPGGAGTGVLTAEEIGSLDLSGVRMVVLSACETGLGRLEAREGLLGLRRAFAIAGARGQVVSLWPVDDEASHQYMLALYGDRFARGRDLVGAGREANLTLLRRLRARGRPTTPALWAGFVVLGRE